jgi:cytochrome P450
MNKPVYEFDYQRDPRIAALGHGAWEALKRDAPPVFWTEANGGHWVANTSRSVIEVLQHPDRFSSKVLTIPPDLSAPKMIPIMLDPPEHRAYRQLLRPWFESKAIEHLEPRVAEWTEQLINDLADKGECEFVEALASRLPISVFMEMFGFPLERFDDFRGLVVQFFNATVSNESRGELAMQIMGLIGETITLRQAQPGNDILSQLLSADFEGRTLDQGELMSICFLMFLAGLDTVTNAMTFGMRHLAQDEALRQRMIDDPDCIPKAVEELMRRYAFVATPRYIVKDTELEGVQLKAGECILAPTMMVGWDDALQSCPEQVTLDRPTCKHAGFGSGIHTCLGIHLARLELISFYRVWFRRIGHFHEIDTGEPPHFRPGSVMTLEKLHLGWAR